MDVLIHTTVPGLVFLVTALIAWRWQAVGGMLLLLEGLIVAVGYPWRFQGRFPLGTYVFMELTMALPPLVAGVLFLAASRMTSHSAMAASP